MTKKKSGAAAPTVSMDQAYAMITQPYLHPKLRTVWNYRLGDEPGDLEKVDPVSLTVPDMTMSLKQLIERHARGLPVPTLGTPQYSETEFPDLERLDLSQIQELQEQNALWIEELTEQQAQMIERERELKNPSKPIPDPENTEP